MIGGCGRVGSAVALGIAALRRRKIAPDGLVSELPPFEDAKLVAPGSLVVGGHEIRNETLLDAVREAHRLAGLYSPELIKVCAPDLRAAQRNFRPGTLLGLSPSVRALLDGAAVPKDETAAAAVERLAEDIRSFKRRHRLDLVVVVNAASSEPAPPASITGAAVGGLAKAMSKKGSAAIPASTIYALAAIESGSPYVNFTPSPGLLPAIREKADRAGLLYMGNDGKTGETLVKSALAPMFAMRNLPVLSWVGQNILGNRDGQVLRDPGVRAGKVLSKDKVVSSIVPGNPTTLVSIEYVPSLDDWKVAWDHIHFSGFLGTKMAMQFTWQGCDSILAAPLIIDLVRFTALEARRGASGPMKHLAFFFKDPIGVREHDLSTQWRGLIEHVVGGNARRPEAR